MKRKQIENKLKNLKTQVIKKKKELEKTNIKKEKKRFETLFQDNFEHFLELGEVAYKTYGGYTDNKNFQNNNMPEFIDLPEKIKKAWCFVSWLLFVD